MTTHQLRRYPWRSICFSAAMLLAAWLGMIAGCTTDGYPTDNTYHVQGKAPSSVPPPSTFAYRYPDTPPVVDADGLKNLVNQYRQRVVLLDFWASWSQTNREEMSMLARLQDELRDEGFQVIACSIDEPEKWSEVIVPILHGAKARFPCVIVPDNLRSGVRNWLDPTWTYEIPTRFVISAQGEVVVAAMPDTPLENVEQQVRDLVLHGRAPAGHREIIAKAAAARSKMINVSTGSYETLRDFSDIEADNEKAVAEKLADQIAAKLDSRGNPRIAILPFPQRAGQKQQDAEGLKTAELVEQALRKRGFTNLVPPAQTQRLIKQAGLSATSIEFQPEMARDAIDCDYLVIGWGRSSGITQTETDKSQAKEDRPTGKLPQVVAPAERDEEHDQSQVRRHGHDEDE